MQLTFSSIAEEIGCVESAVCLINGAAISTLTRLIEEVKF